MAQWLNGQWLNLSFFIRGLEQISRIRGEVMHFDAAGIQEDDLAELRTFAQFLRELRLLVS